MKNLIDIRNLLEKLIYYFLDILIILGGYGFLFWYIYLPLDYFVFGETMFDNQYIYILFGTLVFIIILIISFIADKISRKMKFSSINDNKYRIRNIKFNSKKMSVDEYLEKIERNEISKDKKVLVYFKDGILLNYGLLLILGFILGYLSLYFFRLHKL